LSNRKIQNFVVGCAGAGQTEPIRARQARCLVRYCPFHSPQTNPKSRNPPASNTSPYPHPPSGIQPARNFNTNPNNITKNKSKLRNFLLAAGSSLLAISSASSQSGTWLGNADAWDALFVWSGGTIADGTGNTANFTGNLDISAMAAGAGTLKFGLNSLAGTNGSPAKVSSVPRSPLPNHWTLMRSILFDESTFFSPGLRTALSPSWAGVALAKPYPHAHQPGKAIS
jgi:hypothetical protein